MKILIRPRRALLLGLVSISLTIAQLPLQGQTRRAGPPRQTSASPPQSPPAKLDAKLMLSSLSRGRSMGVAFKTGQLPEPLRKPQGTDDQVAAALAKKVSAGDEQSVPALLAAIMAAGFAVRDPDGSITQTVEPGQGLVFDAWEVAAMAKNYGEGKTTTLTYLTDGLKSIPALKQAPLDKILLEGIRKHAQGNQQLLRFWARFIVELGRQTEQPYDILTENNAENIRLDAVQSALILRRLYGDFYGFAQRNQQGKTGFGGVKIDGSTARRWTTDNKQGQSSFVRIVSRGHSLMHVAKFVDLNLTTSQQNSPCGALGQGDGSTILDAGANVITTGWGALLDQVGAANYKAFLNIANILLAYAKFIATYAALETEITVENPPLVRTTNSVPGGRRQLTAKVTMNVGKWETVNCIRTALNVATGLDFSLLSDGPLEGVEVNWHLDQGGAGDFYSNRGGITGQRQIVGFWNGGPRIQEAGTYAGMPGKGGLPVSNATRTKTDSNGLARVYLEGSPHVPYVPPPMLPVMKRAVVRTTIKLKGGDIKGDAVDIAGQALGGVGALITMPTELLYRTDWASTATLEVPVKDWEECERGWYGTITVSGQLTETKDEMPGGPRGWSLSRINEVKKNFKYTFVLTGERNTSQGSQNGYFADAQINIDNSDAQIEKNRHTGFCDTGRRDARGSKITEKVDGIITTTNSLLLIGAGSSRTTVYIAQRGAAGYNILIEPPPPITGRRVSRFQYDFPECPLWERVNSHSDDRPESIHIPNIEFLATIDPQNPGTISGSRTDRDARSNGTVTYKWELQLCK